MPFMVTHPGGVGKCLWGSRHLKAPRGLEGVRDGLVSNVVAMARRGHLRPVLRSFLARLPVSLT